MISVVSLLVFGTLACSDDEPAASKNNTQPDVGVDVQVVEDSSNPYLPETSGGRDAITQLDVPAVEDTAQDTADAVEEVAVEPDVFPDVDPVECFYPSEDQDNCPQGPYGPGAFITQLQIVPDSSCCFDFDGNGTTDNFLGNLIRSVSALPGFGDVNANISQAISQGDLVYLFEFANWSHPSFDPDLTLTILDGEDTDNNFTANLAGMGDFNVKPTSYDGNGDPKWRFGSARVRDNVLVATDGALEIKFPGLLDEIQLALVKVRIKATVVQDLNKKPSLTAGSRVWLTQGELAGALQRDTLFESLNTAALGCECIEDAQPLFTFNSGTNRFVCGLTSDDVQRCRTASAECQNLADQLVCGFLANQSSQVDVDTTGDGALDAFSFGARFEAVGASIVGLVPTD